MNQPEKKTVFIIPSLKELSKSETKFGKIDEKCGQLGFTNENCMADYNKDLGYKVKRENYTELGKMGGKCKCKFIFTKFGNRFGNKF